MLGEPTRSHNSVRVTVVPVVVTLLRCDRVIPVTATLPMAASQSTYSVPPLEHCYRFFTITYC